MEKTNRCFNFLLWLIKAGKAGISIPYILDEYQISRKTFRRDLKELDKIDELLTIRYDNGRERVFAEWMGPEEKKNSSESLEDRFHFFHRVSQDLEKQEEIHIRQSSDFQLRIQPYELHYILQAILNQTFVCFRYHNKERNALPLFFCHYSERWYLLCLVHPTGRVLKFRMDAIEKVEIRRYKHPLCIEDLLPSNLDIDRLKKTMLARIERSQNIFVDLNEEKNIRIAFRFYISRELLTRDIRHYHYLRQPAPEDAHVHEIEVEFYGYEEARAFMNKWLGKFSILSPEWLIDQYISDLEESIDILKV